MIPSRLGPPTASRSAAKSRICKAIGANESSAGVALALGGGFSRGFAHLGVLEVLEQEGIPVAAIAGTSIGGLLGAAYADGISVERLCELGREVRVRDFIRYNRRDQSAPGNDRISQFVRDWFQAGQIEELPIPTAIVTTDIANLEPYIFTQGPIEVALRATCAYPGLLSPVEYDGRTLADGCIVSPVPTMAASSMHAACVLGVAVGSNEAATSSRRVIRIFNRTKEFWRKRNGRSGSGQADILLQPEVQQIDWHDFSSVEQARAAGAEAARRALPRIRMLLDRLSRQRRIPGACGPAESRAAL